MTDDQVKFMGITVFSCAVVMAAAIAHDASWLWLLALILFVL